MAIKSSGSLSMTEIVAEFGGSVPHSLSEYYRDGGAVPGNNTNVPTSGTISFQNFYDAVNEIQIIVNSSSTNYQTSAAFGSNWTTAVPKRLTINNGVTLGSSNGNPAMVIEGSMGGTLTVHNSGSIQGTGGSGGSGAGGAGGPAVRTDQNGNITFYNNSGAEIYAGGGGGGQGGTGGAGGSGGTGGAGGNGSYNGSEWHSGWIRFFANDYRCCLYYVGNCNSMGERCHQYHDSGKCNHVINTHLGGSYHRTSCYTAYQGSHINTYGLSTTAVPHLSSTGGSGGSGGAGGAGGSGGSGGVGKGYGQNRTDGASGSSGSGGSGGASGANPGNNAGQGGTGGTGGTGGAGGAGGNGGDWGTAGGSGATGSSGATGATGNTGANGNSTNGSGGSSGAGGSSGTGGSSGGATSFYIQNRHYMTFHNSGSVAGS